MLPTQSHIYYKENPNLKEAFKLCRTYFQYGLIPLRLTKKNDEHKETMKWENSVMNSAISFITSVFTIREKEDNHELLELVIKSTDETCCDLTGNGRMISIGGHSVHQSCNIKDTMKD